jgi:formylglycine-generating enzyme required for sulfatase activity
MNTIFWRFDMKVIIRSLLLGIAVVVLAAACKNPFFPARKGGGNTTGGTTTETAGPQVPVISAQPQGATYTIGAAAVPLTVSASVDDEGTLSYQWFSAADNSNEGGTEIPGEQESSYTPPVNALGIVYYYVVVTNTLNDKTAVAASNAAKIEVNDKVNAAVPVITGQPQGAAYVAGGTAEALTVTVSAGDAGTLSYQWYSAVDNSNEGGTEIPGETEASYTPRATTAGAVYYYVIVTNTITDNGDGGNKTAKTASDTAEILVNDKVNAAVPVITGQPQGAAYSTGSTAEALTVTASAGDEGTLSYQWYSNTVDSTTGGTIISGAKGASYTPPTTAVGAVYYYVIVTNTITDNGDGGYKIVQAVSNTAGIGVGVKPVTITGLSAENKVYDGTTEAVVTGTAVIDGVLGGDEVSVIKGAAVFEDKNAGTDKAVTFSGWSLTGAAARNYMLAAQPESVTADITARPVTFTGLSAANKTYDGTATAAVSGTAAISGVVDGDAVTVGAGTAEFADKDIGTEKAVTFSGWSLTGEDADNYSITAQPESVTANITAKPVTITGLSAQSKQYDRTYKATITGTAVISGLVSGDTVTVNAGTAAFMAGYTPGNDLTVRFSGYSLGGADAGNYSLSAQPANVTANITKCLVGIIGPSASNKVYDGTTTVTLTGTPVIDSIFAGDDVSVKQGTAAFADKNVGNSKQIRFSGYSLTGADADYYSITAHLPVYANITAKTLTVTGLTSSNKVYDGTTAATVTGTAALSGVISGDTVTLGGIRVSVFANKNVGTSKAITTSGYTLSGADAGNYSLTQPSLTARNITAKSLTITGLSASNKQYDGTTTATITGTAAFSGVVSGDTVTVSAGTAAFANATVGTGKTVTFSGWSLAGADAGNYSLSTQPASVTANIEYVSMVQISAGTFTMGSPVDVGNSDERPQHSVTLSSFYMGAYEVTQALYELVMGNNPSNFTAAIAGESGTPGRLPVDRVTWYDAVEFCNKLSALEGRTAVYTISGRTPAAGYPITSATVTADFSKNGHRLPTEAQWEYACRAGTTTSWYTANTEAGPPHLNTAAWYSNNAAYKTHQVGLKTPNAWGLYDMHGNVWEWCWDWYGTYASGSQTNPTGAASGSARVKRGGGWGGVASYTRSVYRDSYSPGFQGNGIDGLGFRLVRP